MQNLPSQASILVIGAGPTGLSLAAAAAQKGVSDLLIFEARSSTAREAFKLASRATVVHAGTLDEIEQTLGGVADEIVQNSVIVKTGGIFERGIKSPILAGDFSWLPSKFNQMTIIPQSKTEEILETHLNSLNAKVHYSCEFVSFTETQDKVHPITVKLRSKETDQTFEIKTKYLVGADGWNSKVRNTAGIEFPGSIYATRYLLGDVRLADPLWPHSTKTEARGCSYLGRFGPLLIIPMPGGLTRIVADDKTFNPKAVNAEDHGFSKDDAPPSIEELQCELDRRGPECDEKFRSNQITELVWNSRFRVHHRLAETFRKGNVMLVGDAAHIHSPAGGQGMNIGIRDSLSLGTALAQILTLPPSPGLEDDVDARLEAWASKRKDIAQRVITFTDAATRMTTISNPILIWIRNKLLRFMSYWFPKVMRRSTYQMSGLDFR